MSENPDSTEGEIWREYRAERQRKKANNEHFSIELLRSKGIKIIELSRLNCHYRVGEFDFWPTTGKFYCQKTGQKGRGVKNLIEKLKNESK